MRHEYGDVNPCFLFNDSMALVVRNFMNTGLVCRYTHR